MIADAITRRLPQPVMMSLPSGNIAELEAKAAGNAFVIDPVGQGDKVGAVDARAAFSAGFGDLFAEEEDLFDD
jgi:hypothetical protein